MKGWSDPQRGLGPQVENHWSDLRLGASCPQSLSLVEGHSEPEFEVRSPLLSAPPPPSLLWGGGSLRGSPFDLLILRKKKEPRNCRLGLYEHTWWHRMIL